MNFLTGFTSGLLLITLSELGDKTFFIAAILAMRHPRRWVFIGATAALATMTLLSVGIGQLTSLLPQHYVQAIAVALFIGFGLKLLYDASRMSGKEVLDGEQAEALEVVKQREQGIVLWSARAIVMEAFALTFVAEWGDRTQIATITLASSHHPYGVLLGAIMGHAICAAIAVACGKLIAGHISERLLTTLGGVLFIVFGIITAIENF
ncbi:TMEM165/GDT1 family protein [Synechocystis salina]|uniref:GDT1 family protein n=1 Tax=Synechocystis salina LEGE 00031 TaxID=1828736 RepID=A0ABR9VTQ5_9SYNC|nr:TMEM165/GDT1 family protein [Synechocystis salina]MBE9242928.1 TMEM165/GDT1 family protein [Synechocystis salina LEGE 00041]MBE9253823.1 TMEM165/GDT1 family protein [Synechocystis salina LEGE 00031]